MSVPHSHHVKNVFLRRLVPLGMKWHQGDEKTVVYCFPEDKSFAPLGHRFGGPVGKPELVHQNCRISCTHRSDGRHRATDIQRDRTTLGREQRLEMAAKLPLSCLTGRGHSASRAPSSPRLSHAYRIFIRSKPPNATKTEIYRPATWEWLLVNTTIPSRKNSSALKIGRVRVQQQHVHH